MNESQNLIFLWKRYASGDEKAFDEIFEIYYPILFSYALGILKQQDLAENTVADVFTKIIQYPSKDQIETPESWFFTITKNLCLSYWRKRNRRQNILTNITSRIQTTAFPDAEINLDRVFIIELIEKKLSERDFAIWELVNEGYDNSEIADTLGISKKTVGNRKSMIKSDVSAIFEELEKND